jgi:hypothetical protein
MGINKSPLKLPLQYPMSQMDPTTAIHIFDWQVFPLPLRECRNAGGKQEKRQKHAIAGALWQDARFENAFHAYNNSC